MHAEAGRNGLCKHPAAQDLDLEEHRRLIGTCSAHVEQGLVRRFALGGLWRLHTLTQCERLKSTSRAVLVRAPCAESGVQVHHCHHDPVLASLHLLG